MNLGDVPFSIKPKGLKKFLDRVKSGFEDLYTTVSGLTVVKPRFLAVPSAAQGPLAKDTYHAIAFQTVRRNEGGYYSAETYKFKASIDGDYTFGLAVLANNIPIDATAVQLRLIAGSHTYVASFHPTDHPNAGASDIVWPFSTSVISTPMTKGQYAYIDIYQQGGSTPHMGIYAPETHFSGCLI